MKRLITLAIAVAFILGTVGMVKAAELTISGGDFRVHGNYVKNPYFQDDFEDDKFNLYQRFRTTFNFVANENLKAVAQLQFGGEGTDSRWGDPSDRGLPGGAVRDVHFRQLYLDFMIPNTDARVKAGHQWWALPNTLGSHIFDWRAPALSISTPINDMVGVTLAYARTADEFNRAFDLRKGDFRTSQDEIDHFVAIVPVTMDGFSINPFFHYARVGKYVGEYVDSEDFLGLGVNTGILDTVGDERAQNIYWFGVNATVDMFDPIVVHADFNYGYADNPRSGLRGTRGWVATLAGEYKMDMMTPMLFGLYESGESRSSGDADSKGKIMPQLAGDLTWSSFSTGGSQFGGTSWYAGDNLISGWSTGAVGRWGVGLKLQDISFMDRLSHQFLVAYYQGTNKWDERNYGLFTTKDRAWEVNFDTTYQIYENLAAILELGYLSYSLKSGTIGEVGVNEETVELDRKDLADDAAWKAAFGFRYRF